MPWRRCRWRRVAEERMLKKLKPKPHRRYRTVASFRSEFYRQGRHRGFWKSLERVHQAHSRRVMEVFQVSDRGDSQRENPRSAERRSRVTSETMKNLVTRESGQSHSTSAARYSSISARGAEERRTAASSPHRSLIAGPTLVKALMEYRNPHYKKPTANSSFARVGHLH